MFGGSVVGGLLDLWRVLNGGKILYPLSRRNTLFFSTRKMDSSGPLLQICMPTLFWIEAPSGLVDVGQMKR